MKKKCQYCTREFNYRSSRSYHQLRCKLKPTSADDLKITFKSDISENKEDTESSSEEETESSNEEEMAEYVVEAIVDKRTTNGQIEYLVKWEGCSSAKNTWELAENLSCTDEIEEFEAVLKKKENPTRQIKPDDSAQKSTQAGTSRVFAAAWPENAPSSESNKRQTNSLGSSEPKRHMSETVKIEPNSDELNGFDRGLELEEIIGANIMNQEIQLYIKWVDHPDPEFVPSRIVNVKCPQEVIEFYERQLILYSPQSICKEE